MNHEDYAFDSLGRPLTIRRPDAVADADKRGVNVAYAGLTVTSTEFVGRTEEIRR